MVTKNVKRKSSRARKSKETTAPPTRRVTFAEEVGGEAPQAIMPAVAAFIPRGAAPQTGSVQFSILDSPALKTAQAQLSDALKKFMDDLGSAIQNVATLEVRTYVSDNMEGVTFVDGKFTNVTLRAVAEIALDGDISAVVPTQVDQLDESLWTAHTAMVAQAQSNRTELIKLALSAASSVITALKPA